MTTYILIFILLLLAELIYFRIADKFNIIDKPNERSSHTSIVLRGGGIIFLIGAWVWSAFFGFEYPWFLAGLTLVAGVSFVDDARLCKACSTIRGCGDGFLSAGHAALADVVDRVGGSYCICGGYEYYQLYGWY